MSTATAHFTSNVRRELFQNRVTFDLLTSFS